MPMYQKLNLSKQKNRISEYILDWSTKNGKVLNVISPPYNSVDIFINVILFHIFNNKRVMYITDEKCENLNIIKSLKSYLNVKTINKLFKICCFYNAVNISENYDLIIYDSISTFLSHNKDEIYNLIYKLSNHHSKVILYSIEDMFNIGSKIVFPARDDEKPLIEPRTVLTRIDITSDIPFLIYDYLKCSIMSSRKVIICIPDNYNIERIYRYIYKYCSNMTRNITCVHKIHDSKVIENFNKFKRGVYITDNFDIFDYSIQGSDAIVYFSDNSKFDYKKLVYICAAVNRNRKNLEGEVIFLANEETYDMDKAKDIMRSFNKIAWEQGLLKI